MLCSELAYSVMASCSWASCRTRSKGGGRERRHVEAQTSVHLGGDYICADFNQAVRAHNLYQSLHTAPTCHLPKLARALVEAFGRAKMRSNSKEMI